jgi:hypothetical protein
MALLQQHLQHARQHMKLVADKKRIERVFAVGDWVFLKMQPYVQKSLATRANPKLAFRYFGPFQVLQRVGGTSYKLQLPDGCLIHSVIHVSQLRHGVPPSTPVITDLPAPSASPPEPVKVLEMRLYKHGGGTHSRCASSGWINLKRWQHGKTSTSSSIVSQTQQLGDKLVLNREGMLRMVPVPRLHTSLKLKRATLSHQYAKACMSAGPTHTTCEAWPTWCYATYVVILDDQGVEIINYSGGIFFLPPNSDFSSQSPELYEPYV